VRYVALLGVLVVLFIFSPAEARLGNVVKIVYAHGAMERVATWAYILAGGLGLVSLASRALTPISHLQSPILHWTRALTEVALVFWLAQIVISAPAQMMAWGGITLSEPRVASALRILFATALVYGVARWMDKPLAMAFAALANLAIVVIVLHNTLNVLHPLNPIVDSDSTAIKIFYTLIVVTAGLLAVQLAVDRVEQISRAFHARNEKWQR